MVKYVGIKTAAEADALNEEYVKSINEYNKKLRTQRNWIMFGVLCLALLAIFIVNSWTGNNTGSDETTRSVIVPILIGMFGVDGFLLFCYHDAMECECDWKRPFAYRFFKLTDGKKILKTDVSWRGENGNRDLLLTLKNNNNEVAHERINGFKTVIKTDINDIIVDLSQGILFLPYEKYNW